MSKLPPEVYECYICHVAYRADPRVCFECGNNIILLHVTPESERFGYDPAVPPKPSVPEVEPALSDVYSQSSYVPFGNYHGDFE